MSWWVSRITGSAPNTSRRIRGDGGLGVNFGVCREVGGGEVVLQGKLFGEAFDGPGEIRIRVVQGGLFHRGEPAQEAVAQQDGKGGQAAAVAFMARKFDELSAGWSACSTFRCRTGWA